MTASLDRLRSHVAGLEGPRDRRANPDALRRAAEYVHRQLEATGIRAERRPFRFGGVEHHNIAGILPGAEPERPRVLVGAHFDSVATTPGADDNASGVAAMLEVARILAARPLRATVEFAGFNLEEPQGMTYRVGSRAWAREARRQGIRYRAALVLEMLGFTSSAPGSQTVPALLFWKQVPRVGNFLAATGDGQSAALLREFAAAAHEAVPELPVVTFRTPFRGWLVPQTRLSDNASFWDEGYPSLMLTDTAFLRNPHYHRATDRAGTLDFGFMAQAVEAVVAAVERLAGQGGKAEGR